MPLLGVRPVLLLNICATDQERIPANRYTPTDHMPVNETIIGAVTTAEYAGALEERVRGYRCLESSMGLLSVLVSSR